MPIPKVDNASGAIIFHPTDEEIRIKQVSQENEELQDRVALLERKIEALENILGRSLSE